MDRVYGVSAPVPTAVNDKLLLRLVQLNFIDPLPLEAQNILLDVDSHIPVLCKVLEALYTNRLRGDRHPFSLIEPEKTHSPPTGKNPTKIRNFMIELALAGNSGINVTNTVG
jgi:hypothetical protein